MGDRGGRGGRGGSHHHGRGRGRGRHFDTANGKRSREDAVYDPRKNLLRSLMTLGDMGTATPDAGLSVDDLVAQIEDFAGQRLSKAADDDPTLLPDLLVQCAVELPTKTSVYATVIGLFNAHDSRLGVAMLERICTQLSATAAAGDITRTRLLVRLLAALSVVNVVHFSSVLQLLNALVDLARSHAAQGGPHRLWQPYTDRLVYLVLLALPWAGAELSANTAGVPELLEGVAAYMEARPCTRQPALQPFSAPLHERDAAAESDCGGASLLGQVWEATTALGEAGWMVEGIPAVHGTFEARLAAGEAHTLPSVPLPEGVPGVGAATGEDERAAAVAASHPPRGDIRLLPKVRTEGERLSIERFVAEDYILDTIYCFDGDRNECSERLALQLPLPYAYEPLLAEVLFSQMLRLPAPQLKPLAYCGILVDLCRRLETRGFARHLSGCVRELFLRAPVLDPELTVRFAEWLAFHLSNFDFRWPWERWAHVLDKPPHDRQRAFCTQVLSRLQRLAFWERVQSRVPPSFHPMLPPKPEPLPLPTDDAEDLEGNMVVATIGQIRAKLSMEDTAAWLEAQGAETALGGPLPLIGMLVRALFTVGAKSFTHMIVALERYAPLLAPRIAAQGVDGEVEALSAAMRVWASSAQRCTMAVDRLLSARLVAPGAVVRWVFGSPALACVADSLRHDGAWEALYVAVQKDVVRAQDAREELARVQERLTAAEGTAAAAASAAAAGGVVLPPEHAAALLDPLRAELAEAESDLKTGLEEQRKVMLLVLQCFASALEGGRPSVPEAPEEGTAVDPAEGETAATAAAAAAQYDSVLANLKSFCRRYWRECVPMLSVLREGCMAEGKVPDQMRLTAIEHIML